MKSIYGYFCKIEEGMVNLFLVALTFLVFFSAMARTFGFPVNWAIDLSLLLFAWVVFLGADVALRHTELVSVDMFLVKFPLKVQKYITLLWNSLIVAFLAFLVLYGIPLALESSKRLFQTLGISYSWATITVPIGAILMIITTGIKLFKAGK